MQKDKNEYFQIIRGICIVSVIIIHSLEMGEDVRINMFNIGIRTIINFCVAIFVFMSGYFVNENKIYKDKIKWVIERIKRLGVPFLIWSIIYTIKLMLLDNESFSLFKFIIGKSATQLYYIVVLLQLTILTPILVIIKNKKSDRINRLLLGITPLYLIILSVLNIKFSKQIPLYETNFIAWFTYYYLVMLMRNQKKSDIIRINYGVIILIALLFIIINEILYVNGTMYSYCISQVKITNMIYSYFIIGLILKYKEKKVKNKVFLELGNESFGIYFLHLIYIIGLKKILSLISLNYFMKIAICIVCTTVFSYYTIKIVKKITNEKINKYLGL